MERQCLQFSDCDKEDRYRSSHMVKQKELVATWWKRSSNKQVLSRPCSSYLAR